MCEKAVSFLIKYLEEVLDIKILSDDVVKMKF